MKENKTHTNRKRKTTIEGGENKRMQRIRKEKRKRKQRKGRIIRRLK